jgi:glucosylceramidase
MLLDIQGGPNHLKNWCDAPLIADVTKQQLHYQIMYYYLGQITRFVVPDSVRISSQVTDHPKTPLND